jgi:hypothetical protein
VVGVVGLVVVPDEKARCLDPVVVARSWRDRAFPGEVQLADVERGRCAALRAAGSRSARLTPSCGLGRYSIRRRRGS